MANLTEIKAQIIAMNPNNEEWAKWANSQKRVENLTNGETLKDEHTLKGMFERWRSKHSNPIVKSTISNEEKELLNQIRKIKDNGFLESIIKACEEQIEANNNAQRKEYFNEALESIKNYLAIGGDIKEVLDQL